MRTTNLKPPKTADVNTISDTGLGRLWGNRRVEWEVDGTPQRLQAHLRFADFEGYPPSLKSIAYLHKSFLNHIRSKKYPILNPPVPYLVIDAIQFLSKIVNPQMKVLELGGGNSTLWFLSNGVYLTTIEHSVEWAGFIKNYVNEHSGKFQEDIISNFQLHISQGNETVELIQTYADEYFDLILIDSAYKFTPRNDCIQAACSKIKHGGWMVLDNSDHPVNWLGVDMMENYERIRFSGYTPIGWSVSQTSFWQVK